MHNLELCHSLATVDSVRVESLPRDLMTRIAVTPAAFPNHEPKTHEARIDTRAREQLVVACQNTRAGRSSSDIDVRSKIQLDNVKGERMAVVYLNRSANHILWNDIAFALSGPLSASLVRLAWPDPAP